MFLLIQEHLHQEKNSLGEDTIDDMPILNKNITNATLTSTILITNPTPTSNNKRPPSSRTTPKDRTWKSLRLSKQIPPLKTKTLAVVQIENPPKTQLPPLIRAITVVREERVLPFFGRT